eukprot:291878-Prymnesium_polylepis.2
MSACGRRCACGRAGLSRALGGRALARSCNLPRVICVCACVCVHDGWVTPDTYWSLAAAYALWNVYRGGWT